MYAVQSHLRGCCQSWRPPPVVAHAALLHKFARASASTMSLPLQINAALGELRETQSGGDHPGRRADYILFLPLQINAALGELRETQSGWTIPDTALRANMKDAIIDDFLPAYQVRGGGFDQLLEGYAKRNL